jgi:hypothetical protein
MNQLRTINGIFEKGTGRDYTDDALLYQDILAYSTIIKKSSSENVSFKFTELANWLLKNNTEFLSYYDSTSTRRNTPFNARIHAQQTRIQNKINDLIALKLIETKGTIKAEKNILETPLYAYTKLGYLLNLIIDSRTLEKQISNERKPEKVVDKKKDLDSVNNELFCLLDSVFFKVEQNSSSATIFYSHFIKKCKDKGLFSKLIEHIVDVAHSNHGVKNMRDLFEHVMDLDFKEGETRRYFLDLWRETIDELEPEVAALILFQMKLNAERRFQNIREYFTREYEEMHFQNRNDYERIVVEGDCIKCNFQTVIALPYLDYRKRFSLVTRDDTIKLDCPKCGTKDSLVIPNF